jgi:hypothetical protein
MKTIAKIFAALSAVLAGLLYLVRIDASRSWRSSAT